MTQTYIMSASSKGGVGKSTVALGLSRALAARGKRVLLCDLDFANACLDILSGVEDSVVYTLYDVAKGTAEPEKAVTVLPTAGGGELMLLASPTGGALTVSDTADGTGITPADVAAAVKKAAESVGADFVILDTGAGVSGGSAAAASLCGSGLALVIASHNPTSLRAAENTAARLTSQGIGSVRLVINSFDADGVSRKSSRTGLVGMIDQSHMQLVGAVPYEYALMLSQESEGEAGDAEKAFANIAARLCGEYVPLFDGIRKIRKNRKKLFI